MSTARLRWWPLLWILVRTYGWRGMFRRARHEFRRQVSWFKRAPAVMMIAGPGERFEMYRPHADLTGLSGERRVRAVDRGRKVLDGWYEAYGHAWRRLPESADAWHLHSQTGFRFPSDVWWTVPHFPRDADIKDVWEPGRFGWAYDLVRAHVVTSEPAFARAFHQRLASWQEANPPYRGVHWACGQEVAIRALAILHAADALPLPEDGQEAARQRIWSILGWSGERIADAIGYALSQRNNHGLSEAAGLVHLGLRLRGQHPDADRWLRLGRRYLAEQIRDQFATDGWYAQHSFTYARVALEQSLLAERVLQLSGWSLPADCLHQIRKCVGLLTELVASESGVVPNHGANDGARIAPFSTTEYRDFRPVLTLASLVLEDPMPADIAHDEDVVRWFGRAPQSAATSRPDGAFSGPSGWAVARVNGTSVFLRAGAYTHRPSHMDLLHLDVRFGGNEVVTDAGTYTYNGARLWKDLVSAAVHNGPVLDDQEPAERGPRFLWCTWPSAAIVRCHYRDGSATVTAEIPGRVRRRIEATGATVTVFDQMIDHSAKTMQVTWLLNPERLCGVVEAEGGRLLGATDDDVHAWFCPAYGRRIRAQALQIRRNRASGGDAVVTVIRRSGETAA